MPRESNRTKEDRLKKAHELGNSRELYAWRLSDYPEVKSALNHVFDQIKTEFKIRADTEKKYRDHVRVIVLDLFVANKNDPSQFITYSRSPNAYSKGTVYARMFLKHRIANNIIEFLIKNDYVENHKGYYRRDRPYDSKKSRMRASDKLLDLLEKQHRVEIGMIRWDDREPVLILRNEAEQEVPFDDTPATLAMKENLKQINKNLERHSVLLYVKDNDLRKVKKKKSKDSEGPVPDFTRKWLRRIFNNSSFEQGGRFYGGWWENIRKEYRKDIRLDDKDVVELDYSGLHINMLYAIESLPMPEGDVYHLDGYSNSGIFRKFVKKLLQAMINAPDRDKARKGIHKNVHRKKTLILPKEIRSTRREDINPLMDALEKKHRPIKHYLCSGKGVALQYLDSQMAEKIMLHFSKINYPVLPLHDSFIIHHSLEEELRVAMNAAFKEMFGVEPKVDSKYRSIEERMKEGKGPKICEASARELLQAVSEKGEYGTYFRLLNQHWRYFA